MKIDLNAVMDELIEPFKVELSASELLVLNKALFQFAENKINHKIDRDIATDMREEIIHAIRVRGV